MKSVSFSELMLTAVEFGFKSAERGNNLDMTLKMAREEIKAAKKETDKIGQSVAIKLDRVSPKD